MMEPEFITVDEVLEIHEEQLERYGGSHGLRDAGGLESAIAFLWMNGWNPTFGEEEFADLVLSVAAGVLSQAQATVLFEVRCEPIPD